MDWATIGQNLINGIKDGVLKAASALIDSVMDAAGKALDAVKNFLGIHSPSTLMRDLIGKNMIAGIEVGIESEEDNLASTASGTTRKAVKSMQEVSAQEVKSALKGRTYQISAENDYPKQSALFVPAGDGLY